MNVRNFLFMNLTGKVLPFANLEDIMLAQTLGEKVRTIIGNPLTFKTKKAQKALNPSLTLLPIQDLHGYDSAWIGGMSDQLLDESTAEQGTIDQTTGEDVPSSGVKRSDFMPTKGATNIFLGTSYGSMRFFWYDSNKTYLSNDACAVMTSVAVPNNTAYFRLIGVNRIWDNPIMINSGTTQKPYCPYENICPISGRTMSSVWGSKKNMLPTSLSTIKSLNTIGEWNGNAYTINNVTFTVQTDGDKVVGINANGQASADATLFIYGNTTAIFSSTTITFKVSGKIRIGTPTNGSGTTFLGVVWSTIQNKFIYGTELFDSGYTMNGFGVRIKNGYNAQNVLFKPIIYMADEDYTFEPYEQSCFINFTFGQTVYGGKVDFDTGVMSIDTLRVDLGTLNWNTTSTSGIFYADDDLGEFIGTGKTIVSCDSFLCCDNASGLGQARLNPNGSICGYSGSGTHRWYIRYDGITSKTDLIAAVNGVYACYKLATPQIIQLTPQEINLLKGVNNIWTDGDSIELTYKG